jgi:hypothetical protein
LLAVAINASAIGYITDPVESAQLVAVIVNRELLNSIKNPTRRVIAFVINNPYIDDNRKRYLTVTIKENVGVKLNIIGDNNTIKDVVVGDVKIIG